MEFFDWVFQDWSANRTRLDSQLILAFFRFVQYLRQSAPTLGYVVNVPYKVIVSTIVGVELPPTLRVGPRLKLYHPHNIVIHRDAVVGADCLIRHGLTIGTKQLEDGSESRAPIVGDHVEFGASSILIGDIEVSSNCIVGAGAVVTKSVPEGSVAVGNPFRIIPSSKYCN
jgi:putative colanic acid biosynthesis acetyltransferase WcaB